MTATELPSLSAEEIAQYQRDGQITPCWRLPAEQLHRMRRALDTLIAARNDVRPDFISLPHVASEKPKTPEVARAFFEFATQPLLLALVEPLIGSDIILWASSVFCKPL